MIFILCYGKLMGREWGKDICLPHPDPLWYEREPAYLVRYFMLWCNWICGLALAFIRPFQLPVPCYVSSVSDGSQCEEPSCTATLRMIMKGVAKGVINIELEDQPRSVTALAPWGSLGSLR